MNESDARGDDLDWREAEVVTFEGIYRWRWADLEWHWIQVERSEGMSVKWGCVIAKAGSNLLKSFQMVVARLGEPIVMFVKGETCQSVTLRSLMVSDGGIVDPATLIWVRLDKELLRWWVQRRIASDLDLRQDSLSENHCVRPTRADSSIWMSLKAEDWEIEIKSWMLINTLSREEIGETYTVKRRGPWGMPEIEDLRLDEELPILTYCERFDR